MGDASIGIDISAAQNAVAPGPWLFAIHKATEGHDYTDPQFAGRYQSLRNVALLVGAYHYARPADGFDGTAQADFFADVCLSAGFRAGVDMWQLDCEGIGNEGVTSAMWSAFVPAFMERARFRLGDRGFMYCGFYFEAAALRPLAVRYPWWDADYGPNDGAVHPLPLGANPVIHQFASNGGLDRNVIHDAARWASIVGSAPPPAPAPIPKVQPMHNPPLVVPGGIVADLACPTGGAWLVADDGAIFAVGGAPYLGGMNTDAHFKGRHAAKLLPRRYGTLGRKRGYTIVATSGETYVPVVPSGK